MKWFLSLFLFSFSAVDDFCYSETTHCRSLGCHKTTFFFFLSGERTIFFCFLNHGVQYLCWKYWQTLVVRTIWILILLVMIYNDVWEVYKVIIEPLTSEGWIVLVLSPKPWWVFIFFGKKNNGKLFNISLACSAMHVWPEFESSPIQVLVPFLK